MSKRRITANRSVFITGGRYRGKSGITEERQPNGDWLIRFKDFSDYVSKEHIKPPAETIVSHY